MLFDRILNPIVSYPKLDLSHALDIDVEYSYCFLGGVGNDQRFLLALFENVLSIRLLHDPSGYSLFLHSCCC